MRAELRLQLRPHPPPPPPQHDKSFSWLPPHGGEGGLSEVGYEKREKKRAPLFQSPHLGKRSREKVGVGVGLRLGTSADDRLGMRAAARERVRSISRVASRIRREPEGGRGSGSQSQASRRERGKGNPPQIGRFVKRRARSQ